MISTVAAMVIQSGRVLERLASQNVELNFLEALSEGSEPFGVLTARARQLGMELDERHVAAAFQVMNRGAGHSDPEEALDRLGEELLGRFPFSAVARRGLELVALLRVRATGATGADVNAAVDLIESHDRLQLSGGLSGVARGVAGYGQAFAEAHDALNIGKAMPGLQHVVEYDALGAVRHLWTLAGSSMRDRFQEYVEQLRAHDEEHGTQLFETVEAYLDEQGNREKVSGAGSASTATRCGSAPTGSARSATSTSRIERPASSSRSPWGSCASATSSESATYPARLPDSTGLSRACRAVAVRRERVVGVHRPGGIAQLREVAARQRALVDDRVAHAAAGCRPGEHRAVVQVLEVAAVADDVADPAEVLAVDVEPGRALPGHVRADDAEPDEGHVRAALHLHAVLVERGVDQAVADDPARADREVVRARVHLHAVAAAAGHADVEAQRARAPGLEVDERARVRRRCRPRARR